MPNLVVTVACVLLAILAPLLYAGLAKWGRLKTDDVAAFYCLGCVVLVATLVFVLTPYFPLDEGYGRLMDEPELGRRLTALTRWDFAGGALATGGLALTLAVLIRGRGAFPLFGKILWGVVPVAYFTFLRMVPVQGAADAIYSPFQQTHALDAAPKPDSDAAKARNDLRKAFLDHRNAIQDGYTKAWGAMAVLVVASFLTPKKDDPPPPPSPPDGEAA